MDPVETDRAGAAFCRLVEIMAALRGENGCPWDRAQTHESLKRCLVEECYEVLEALDSGQADKLCDELGDLLMQIVFHSQLAAEAGQFTATDVVEAINAKLERRHPHVFGDSRLTTPEEVLEQWHRIKQEENGGPAVSLLEGIPRELPALLEALKIQKRVSGVGFDWEDVAPAIEKLREELSEIEAAHEAKDPEEVQREIGDLLFAAVNVARLLAVEPEDALRQANRRFGSRFRRIEEWAEEEGRALTEMTLEEMDALWEEAKTEAAL